jgi:hypothetical protein
MLDTTEFSVTLALSFTEKMDNDLLHHTLQGVANQHIAFNKVCLLDSHKTIDKDDMIHFFQIVKDVCPSNPHYIRFNPEARYWDLRKRGFQFVNEPCTKQTPLFMFMECNRYLRPDFTTKLKEAFEKHRYTCTYSWQELPKTGPKTTNQDGAFVWTSQVFSHILPADDELENELPILCPVPPWIWQESVDTIVELL